jgi:hypothetical protein
MLKIDRVESANARWIVIFGECGMNLVARRLRVFHFHSVNKIEHVYIVADDRPTTIVGHEF